MATVTEVKPSDVTTQAATIITPKAAEADEARQLTGTTMSRMRAAWAAVGKAEDSISKDLLAVAVESIIPVLSLPEAIRPKYAAIAEEIVKAQGREVHARDLVRNPDDALKVRSKKPNAYRQYATPYVAMARWEAGMFTKPEREHLDRVKDMPEFRQEISYNGEKFSSPVSALKGGVPAWTVYREFRNIFSPNFSDFTKIPATKSQSLAKAKMKSLKVTIRQIDESGDPVKKSVAVLGQHELSTGAILALLEGLGAPLSQSRYEVLVAALEAVKPQA